MKIRSLLALAALAVAFALPVFPQQADTADQLAAQEIRALTKKYDEAFSNQNAAALGGLFTEDGVLLAPDGVYSGRQAIQKRYEEIVFPQWHCNNHVTKVRQVIALGGELCWIAEWSCSCLNADGSTAKVNGYYSSVGVREGDTWKCRIFTFNVVLPAPPVQTK